MTITTDTYTPVPMPGVIGNKTVLIRSLPLYTEHELADGYRAARKRLDALKLDLHMLGLQDDQELARQLAPETRHGRRPRTL